MGKYKQQHIKDAAMAAQAAKQTKSKNDKPVKQKSKKEVIQKGATGFISFFGNVPVTKKGKLKKIKKTYFGDVHPGSIYKSEMASVVKNPANNKGFKSLSGYTIKLSNRMR